MYIIIYDVGTSSVKTGLFVIEMIQLLFPGSVTDIDDLILNAAGVAIGYGIYKLVCRSRGKV